MDSLTDHRADSVATAINRLFYLMGLANSRGHLCPSPASFRGDKIGMDLASQDPREFVQLRWALRDLGEHVAVNAADPDAALSRVEFAVCHDRPDAAKRLRTLQLWWSGLGRAGPYGAQQTPDEGADA